MTNIEYEQILNNVKKLHKINFNQIIKHNNFNESFSYKNVFNIEENRFKSAYDIVDYCDNCKNCNTPKNEDLDYKLCNISHGSHTIDFLEAFGIDDIKSEFINNNWNTQPVLFLMETPSKDYKIYDYIKTDIEHTGKKPAHNWYWIHEDWTNLFKENKFNDSRYYGLKSYGKMVASLIYQYKLANAYLTNIVKCGMNSFYFNGKETPKEKFLNLYDYKEKCIEICINSILVKEIEALRNNRKLIIFAFGNRTYQTVRKYFNDNNKYEIVKMPHPADYHISNDYRKYILKGIVEEILEKYDCNIR